MIAGAVKAVPGAALLGALSVQNLALYATVVSLLAGVLVISAVWAAARAWRERAEARSDEATQLAGELETRQAENQKLHERVSALEKSRDFVAAFEPLTRAIDQGRADSTHEHEKILVALDVVADRLGEVAKGLAANTGVVGALAAGIHADSAAN